MRKLTILTVILAILAIACSQSSVKISGDEKPATPEVSGDDLQDLQSVGEPAGVASVANMQPATHAEIDRYALLPISELGQIGHLPGVFFTKDGKRKIVGTDSGKVVIVDRQTGKPVWHFVAIEGTLWCLAISPDERFVCAVSLDRKAIVREIGTGNEIAQADGIDAKAAAFSPDGQFIALAVGNDIELRTSSLELKHKFQGHTAKVNAVSFNPKGTHIASVSDDKTVRLWDVNTKQSMKLEGHTAELYAVSFTPDGKHLASGGKDNAIKIWEVETGKMIHDTLGPQPFWITALGFSPCGRYLGAGDESCDVWIYEWQEKKLIHHGKHHHECWLTTVAWSSDGEFLTFGCRPNVHHPGSLQAADPDAILNLAIQNNDELREGMRRVQELQMQRLNLIGQRCPKLKEKIEEYKKMFASQISFANFNQGSPVSMAAPEGQVGDEVASGAVSISFNGVFQNQGGKGDLVTWLEGLPELKELEENDPELKKLSEEIRKLSAANDALFREEEKKARETIRYNFAIKQWRLNKEKSD